MDVEGLLELMPFAAASGVEIVSADEASAIGRLAWAPDRCTAAGVLHGGALMLLADTIGATCAFVHLPAGASTSTIESKTNFFRAVRAGLVTAVAKPLHVGRSTIVVQTEMRDDDGRLVAITTQTQAVLV